VSDTDLSKWYAQHFKKPYLNYLEPSVRIDLGMLNHAEQLALTRIVLEPITQEVYQDRPYEELKNDSEVGYRFYFAMLNCSNKVILESLFKLFGDTDVK
jgi:hypothetical protein